VRPNQGGPSNSSVAAGAPRDAGLVQPVDAELVGDAGAGDVAIRSNPLVIQNPSFERNGGVGGDVLLEKLISLFPVVNLIFAELPDWYACFPLSVSSLTWLLDGDAGAQQSPTGDYLSFVINGTSVRQQLAAPLVPGTAYAFEFDVISESGGGQNLYLEARGAAALCGNGVVLGRSPVVRDGADWSTSCVSFTADDAYSYLLLAPNYEGNAPGLTARLRVDGLRQVERCP